MLKKGDRKMKTIKLCILSVAILLTIDASAQLKIGDQPTIQQKSVALDVKGSNGLQGLWLPRVSDTTFTGIGSMNPPNGLIIFYTPTGKLLVRANNAWVAYLENGIQTVTAGGNTMSGPALTYNTGTTGTDFNISSTGNIATWNIPDASTTARGAVTTTAQTFGGAKTFANGATVNNGATINNGSTLNNGTTANGGLTVSGATTNTSNLTLGVTSATTPGAATDRYLSVNAAGNVTLNNISNVSSVTAGGSTLTGALTYNSGTAGTDFNISSAGNVVTWNLPDASTTARGAVTTSAQTFAGLKTFNNGATINGGAILNGGTNANGGLTVSGATTNTSNLTLGVTSATTPAAATDRYLSVNAAGNVTLNSISAINSVTAGGNTMTGPALTYNTGTTGTDFNISSTGNIATWNLPDASTTARGAVTTGAQTFGGAKTFANGATVNNGSTLNGGTTANGGLTVSGATTNTSNLTLGVTSATTPGAATDRYLSVNAAGNVTLNNISNVSSVTAGGSTLTGALTYNSGTAGADFNISSAGNVVTWNLPDASTTARGAVTTGVQTFGGAKTFANGLTVNNGSTLNAGTTANGGLTVSGATTNTSNLTLGINSATAPGAATTKYLTVNAAGNVTLNSISAISSVTAGGNTMTGPALTYNTGTTGTDFNISSTGNIATWNLPDASTTARGAVTTGAQTFGGLKTFANGATVDNGATVTGSTNTYKSNLTLGINALTPAGGSRDKYLSVDTAGKVTLNEMSIVANTSLRFKSYLQAIDNAPMNLSNNTPTMYTFTIAGANFSTQAAVVVTPLFQFKLGAGILYSRVKDANTIEMVLNYSGNGTQPINSGTNGLYNITVIEYQ
jgi:hypothetical protein